MSEELGYNKVDIKYYTCMWLNISKGTVSCRKTGVWDIQMQSQDIAKYSPKVDFEISDILDLQYLIFKLLDLVQIQCFLVKIDLIIPKIPILCTNSQLLRAFFSKLTFHQSVMTSSIQLLYLKNAMSDFKNSCTKIEMKEQPFRKY